MGENRGTFKNVCKRRGCNSNFRNLSLSLAGLDVVVVEESSNFTNISHSVVVSSVREGGVEFSSLGVVVLLHGHSGSRSGDRGADAVDDGERKMEEMGIAEFEIRLLHFLGRREERGRGGGVRDSEGGDGRKTSLDRDEREGEELVDGEGELKLSDLCWVSVVNQLRRQR